MCAIEERGLQQGMSFRTRHAHSVILMSQRKGAPYPDRLSFDGKTLTYIGHDAYGDPNKARIDQPLATPQGTLTQNGHFYTAAHNSQTTGHPELVRVYEKLHQGVWVFNGLFRLVDARMESDGTRQVCVFELRLIEAPLSVREAEGEGVPGLPLPPMNGGERGLGGEGNTELPLSAQAGRGQGGGASALEAEATQIALSPGRLIPSDVKLAVYKRDKGMCVECLKHGREVKHDLHFDHILPYSLGGSSTNADNIQLLCQQHNLAKSANIE